ncbi:MAG: CopG family antitoxin [Acutalibacteraceae bacterium]
MPIFSSRQSILEYIITEVLKMKPLKQKVSITLDEDIINSVKILAEECDRSFSQYINLVLKEHLKDKNVSE